MLEPILSILKRRRWLALPAFAIPMAGATVLAMSLPGLYRATATILVQRGQEAAAATATGQPEDVETRLQTIREEVLSRQRLDAMVEQLGLYPEMRRRAPREAIIDRLRRDIEIRLKGPEQGAAPAGTIAFSLGYRGADRLLTAKVANSLADSYVQENLRIREQQATGTAEALEGQLSDVRRRLDDQEASIRLYQAAHSGELPQQLTINLARIQQLEMQLQLSREARLRGLDRRDAGAGQSADPRYAELSGSPEAMAARLSRLRQALADMKTTYNDNYPDVVNLKSQISALEGRAKNAPADSSARRQEPRTAGPLAAARYDASEDARLQREIDAYRARVDRAPLREQEFAQLSRDYATTKELYGTLLKRYQEARISQDVEHDGESGQLRILDAAIVPPAPYAPNRRRLLLFGFMVSLAIAAGAVVLAERIDTSFHTVDELRGFTRVPVMVSIPPLRTSALRWASLRSIAWMTILTAAGVAFAGAVSWSFARGNINLVQMLARGSGS